MKKKVFPIMLLALTLFFATTAWSAPQAVVEKQLSRGEFAAMLLEAGGIESDLPPADQLVEKGIMKGYPDGMLYLEKGITNMEAVILAARTLGMVETIVPPQGGELTIAKDHWGYLFYAWLNRFGLADGKPDEILTVEKGKDFLEKVFYTDPAAISIFEKSQEGIKNIKTLRSVFSSEINITARPGVEGAEEVPEFDIVMKAVQEMVFPDSLHQLSSTVVEIPGEGLQEITTEMYLVNGKIYQKFPVNMETGEMQWMRFPEELFPDLEQLMSAEEVATVVPAGFEKHLHNRLLGTVVINDEELYELASYGKVDDFSEFLEAVSGQFSGGQQIQQFLSEAMGMIDSVSFWIIQYIGAADYFTKSAEMFFVISFADEFLGTPNPIETLQMKMKAEEYSYNEEIVILLPDEAVNAPLLDFPGMPLDLDLQ